MGARVRAYDRVGMGQAKEVLGGIEFCDGPHACADGADALVIVTEWEQCRFRSIADSHSDALRTAFR
jgi:UDPglucose 6-dehydrogenase